MCLALTFTSRNILKAKRLFSCVCVKQSSGVNKMINSDFNNLWRMVNDYYKHVCGAWETLDIFVKNFCVPKRNTVVSTQLIFIHIAPMITSIVDQGAGQTKKWSINKPKVVAYLNISNDLRNITSLHLSQLWPLTSLYDI